MPPVEATPGSAAAGEVTTGAASQAQATGSETTPGSEGTTTGATAGEGKEVEFNVPGLEKDGDEYVYRVDPDDPNGTVYIGKTPDEVFANMRKGIAEKDRLIRQTKARERVTDGAETVGVTVPERELPDKQKIRIDLCKKAGIDPAFLSFTDAQWNAFQDERKLRDWQISKAQNRIESIEREADHVYNYQSTEYLNAESAGDQSDAVAELIAEYGVDAAKFDYDTVLDRVMKDKENFKADGTLKSGAIVKEATRELRKMSLQDERTRLQKKLDEDAARGRAARAGVESPGASGGASSPTTHKPEPKAPASTDAAVAEILREMAVKRAQGGS